jgi:hypothetical protein
VPQVVEVKIGSTDPDPSVVPEPLPHRPSERAALVAREHEGSDVHGDLATEVPSEIVDDHLRDHDVAPASLGPRRTEHELTVLHLMHLTLDSEVLLVEPDIHSRESKQLTQP